MSARYGPTTIRIARERVRDAGALLLEDSGAEACGLSFWGSPWVPFFNHWAFNLPQGGSHLAEGRSTINAAVLDASYRLARPPVTIDV